MVQLLEQEIGRKAIAELVEMHPGDAAKIFADADDLYAMPSDRLLRVSRPISRTIYLNGCGARDRCGADPTPFCFIPSGTYGAYVADLAQELLASGAVRHIRDAALISLRRQIRSRLSLAQARHSRSNGRCWRPATTQSPLSGAFPRYSPGLKVH